MKIYNSLTHQIEDLLPRQSNQIDMFVCGPTVYDYIHIGNARTFVLFDAFAKYLRHRGFDVNYIQNITDIDDKIIQRAQDHSLDPLVWAKKYEAEFLSDMDKLGVSAPSKYARATDHILQVIQQVKTLKTRGHAYLIKDDGWYFDLSTFKEYGKLSRRNMEMADDAVSRIDQSDKKRNRGDFCLWKLSKPDEPAWNDNELGLGRPGWHIEDTAITEAYFGPQYDLHGGGQDLMFPHHEAEIAQQEAASGKSPFVRYWLHVAFLINETGKMSKSAGNFSTARELLDLYSPQTLRHYLLARAHYRTPLQFSIHLVDDSRSAVNNIRELLYRLTQSVLAEKPSSFENIINEKENELYSNLDNDFNIPAAMGSFSQLVFEANLALDNETLSVSDAQKILKLFSDIDKFLGFIPEIEFELPSEVSRLVTEREKARLDELFSKADEIRTQIENLGYLIDDTAKGPIIKKKN